MKLFYVYVTFYFHSVFPFSCYVSDPVLLLTGFLDQNEGDDHFPRSSKKINLCPVLRTTNG